MIKPKHLAKGDRIAFVAPSSGLGALFPHRIINARKAIQKIGFEVAEFPTVKKFFKGSAGTPEERVEDIHSAFEDSSIRAIITAVGGLSSNEIIGRLDYNLIRKNPKIFCGYSDISILHYAIMKESKLVTFYGPSAMNEFGEYTKPFEYTVKYFLKAASSTRPIGRVTPSNEWTDEIRDWSKKEDLRRPRKSLINKGYEWLNQGKAKGKIIGGCLYSILQLKGTEYDADYKNKILFIETPEGQDFTKGEPLNYVDSQIMDLRNAGVFDKIKGFIVGRPYRYNEKMMSEFKNVIIKHVNNFNFPVLFNVNIGHADPVITVPLNVKVTLDSYNNIFSIDESGVI